MKGLAKGLTTAVLAALVAACDGSPTTASAFAPEEGGIAMERKSRLSFSSTQSYETQTAQTATGAAGAIDFTGSLTTGNPCYDVSATHHSGTNSVTVTVTATSTGGFCAQVITHNNYTGRVSGLAAGTYDFTVIHDVGGSRSTAYNALVTVQ